MSLDDFFARKGKKKSKTKISSQELFEKITLQPQHENTDNDKVAESVTICSVEESEEWDPIVNDPELDLSDIRIGDLSVTCPEIKNANEDEMDSTSKNGDRKVAWSTKAETQTTEEVKPEPETEILKNKNTYVLPHLRENMPNLESQEEFPTLDAAKSAPKKRSYINTSDVTKAESSSSVPCVSQTKEESGPRVYRLQQSNTDSFSPRSYNSRESYSQNLASRYQNALQKEDSSSTTEIGWSRGSVIKKQEKRHSGVQFAEETKHDDNWIRGSVKGSGKEFPRTPQPKTSLFDLPKSNRFSALEDV